MSADDGSLCAAEAIAAASEEALPLLSERPQKSGDERDSIHGCSRSASGGVSSNSEHLGVHEDAVPGLPLVASSHEPTKRRGRPSKDDGRCRHCSKNRLPCGAQCPISAAAGVAADAPPEPLAASCVAPPTSGLIGAGVRASMRQRLLGGLPMTTTRMSVRNIYFNFLWLGAGEPGWTIRQQLDGEAPRAAPAVAPWNRRVTRGAAATPHAAAKSSGAAALGSASVTPAAGGAAGGASDGEASGALTRRASAQGVKRPADGDDAKPKKRVSFVQDGFDGAAGAAGADGAASTANAAGAGASRAEDIEADMTEAAGEVAAEEAAEEEAPGGASAEEEGSSEVESEAESEEEEEEEEEAAEDVAAAVNVPIGKCGSRNQCSKPRSGRRRTAGMKLPIKSFSSRSS